jgi:ABC-type phosphate transport system permease subunit
MRTLLLKAGATAITLATTISAAVFVTSHLKTPQAPLQPVVLAGGTSTVSGFGGKLRIGPSVQPSDAEPVASTYAS